MTQRFPFCVHRAHCRGAELYRTGVIGHLIELICFEQMWAESTIAHLSASRTRVKHC